MTCENQGVLTTMETHDLIIIGGGAGGIASVDAALRRGLTPLLVQDGPMGGDCTWTGCVPSKALISAAARGATLVEGLAEAQRAIHEVAELETADVFRRRGATVIEGRARFLTRDVVEIDGARHRAPRIIIATGARPLIPPIDGLRDADPLTSDSVWDLDDLPSSLVVLGGGPIGCELAHALARLGVEVTLVEGEDQILGREEPRTAQIVIEAMQADGVDIRLGEYVSKVERLPDQRVIIHGDAGSTIQADAVLAAIGRTPITDGLDVASAGVRLTDKGHIQTDDRMRTTAPGVYAVGDVTGEFPFTHGAYEQGIVAVSSAFGRLPWRRFDSRHVPFVTFTDPEVGRVGLTETEAYDAHGDAAKVVELPMSVVDRAIAEGRTEGYVKLIAAPGRLLGNRAGGQLVGATIVGPHAGELIHELSLAMRFRIPPAAITIATHAYPTWGMAVQQAASGFFVDLEGGDTRPARPDSGVSA